MKTTNVKTPLLGRGWGRLFLLLAFIGLSTANAQVGIGTDDPDPSAILEVDVSSLTDKQGFLPPRLSSAERDAIASPPQGLTIFNTTTNAIEFSDGTNWINLNDNSTVAVNTDPAPTDEGDVGIGTETPDANAALDIVSTDRGFLPPRITTAERDAIASPTKGLVIFNETTTCLQWYDGNFWYDGCSGIIADPLPNNITLGEVSAYYILSTNDDDYLDNSGDFINNTTEAQLPGGSEDAVDPTTTNDVLIDILGTLTTTGVTINIPYEVSSGSVDLTAFSQTITIPADYTENNTATDITFSYQSQTGLSGTGVIPATLKAETNDLEVIKFDYNSGSGSDFLGFLLGKFTYVLDDAGNTGDLEVRGTPGVLDKNFGDDDHDLVYIPVVSTPTGKTWLNNNLGANYANINDAAFDPAEQATDSDDEDAYGSRFQWGRDGDGHEIPGSSTDSGPVTAGSEGSDYITGSNDWLSTPDDNRWNANETAGGAVVKTADDPCPIGFRVPTEAEWQAEIDDDNWSNASDAFDSDLALPVAGSRRRDTGGLSLVGSNGRYWSSFGSGTDARRLDFSSSAANMTTSSRADGFSVRCIQE